MLRAAVLTAVAGVVMMASLGCVGQAGGLPAVDKANVWDGKSPYVVRRAAGAISIDKDFHADQWAGAMVMANYLIPEGGGPAREQTTLRLLWDDENLYVHFIAYDTDMQATYTDRLEPIWEEDVAELFLQPDANGDSYHQFEVTPSGIMLALAIANTRQGTLADRADWDSGARCAARAVGSVNDPSDTDEFYKVVLAVPFKNLKFAGSKAPSAGDKWRFLGSRSNISKGLGVDAEPSACVPLREVDFHINPDYGTLTFGK